jgi:hypothetical protein
MEHAGQINRDDALPFLGIDVKKGSGLTDANAIEEHIQSAEFANRRRNCRVNGRAVSDIEAERRGAAAGPTNLRGGRLGRGCIDIGADYRCALTPETESTRPADPATRTSDEHDLCLDPPHVTLLDASIAHYIPYRLGQQPRKSDAIGAA